MKKIISIILCFIIATIPFSSLANEVKVFVNGEELKTDQGATIVDGRTLVPLRAIFEVLGADVEWDDVTKSVEARKRYKKINLQIGSKAIYINQIRNEIDVSAMLINSRTMVPARAVSEALDAKVEWDGDTRTVYIESTPEDKAIKNIYLKEKVTAPDGNIVFEYFCAYPEFISGDTSKNLHYKEIADAFLQSAKSASDIALKDYELSKEKGFLFIPHKMELTYDITEQIEFKKETFDGVKRNTEIIK